jgi:hypothetical protein
MGLAQDQVYLAQWLFQLGAVQVSQVGLHLWQREKLRTKEEVEDELRISDRVALLKQFSP